MLPTRQPHLCSQQKSNDVWVCFCDGSSFGLVSSKRASWDKSIQTGTLYLNSLTQVDFSCYWWVSGRFPNLDILKCISPRSFCHRKVAVLLPFAEGPNRWRGCGGRREAMGELLCWTDFWVYRECCNVQAYGPFGLRLSCNPAFFRLKGCTQRKEKTPNSKTRSRRTTWTCFMFGKKDVVWMFFQFFHFLAQKKAIQMETNQWTKRCCHVEGLDLCFSQGFFSFERCCPHPLQRKQPEPGQEVGVATFTCSYSFRLFFCFNDGSRLSPVVPSSKLLLVPSCLCLDLLLLK